MRLALAVSSLLLVALAFGCAEEESMLGDAERADEAFEQGCFYNGDLYPPGTTVGGLVCTVDSTWAERSCINIDGLPAQAPSETCLCSFDGEYQAPGTQVGPLFCTADGTWVEKTCQGQEDLLVDATVYDCYCVFDGQTHPAGTEVGPYVCSESGSWE